MDCPECERLWCLCDGLIQDQMNLLAEYQVALKSRDVTTVKKLAGPLAGADHFRTLARQDLIDHLATHQLAGIATACFAQ
jgi:hypothetical protein